MGGEDRELGNELQTEEVEMSELRLEMDRNRSEAADRPKLGKKPLKNEGRDGDHRFVKDGNVMYAHHRVGGKWYKVRLESA